MAKLTNEQLTLMSHSNLRITIDKRNHHPFAVERRLQFFAHNANRKLVPINQSTTHKHTLKFTVLSTK